MSEQTTAARNFSGQDMAIVPPSQPLLKQGDKPVYRANDGQDCKERHWRRRTATQIRTVQRPGPKRPRKRRRGRLRREEKGEESGEEEDDTTSEEEELQPAPALKPELNPTNLSKRQLPLLPNKRAKTGN
ncbi:Hypothetical protein FKW44_025193 [Caligus rogercresseyi]|uniref:Uncharacterized protein n=1 Tax=Caligus rogercresseyi TaxID=217165 RepID=A0A7T8JTJ7_CALRO|nr:Hypothetical protein FKW44_025193 [Caligus rogercresseyi]